MLASVAATRNRFVYNPSNRCISSPSTGTVDNLTRDIIAVTGATVVDVPSFFGFVVLYFVSIPVGSGVK